VIVDETATLGDEGSRAIGRTVESFELQDQSFGTRGLIGEQAAQLFAVETCGDARAVELGGGIGELGDGDVTAIVRGIATRELFGEHTLGCTRCRFACGDGSRELRFEDRDHVGMCNPRSRELLESATAAVEQRGTVRIEQGARPATIDDGFCYAGATLDCTIAALDYSIATLRRLARHRCRRWLGFGLARTSALAGCAPRARGCVRSRGGVSGTDRRSTDGRSTYRRSTER
jgi:hypothetical protein